MKHKVLEIFKTFSGDEISKFELFLSSPYFNESKRVLKLYNSLTEFYPDFDSDNLTDEYLSKAISPELEYNRSTMKVLFSKLLNAAETYLTINNIRGKKLEANDFLREELFKRKLLKFIEANIKSSEDELGSCEDFDTNYYLNKFKLATDKSNLFYLEKPENSIGSVFSDMNSMTERGRYLIYFFVTEMIKEYDNLISNHSKFKSECNAGFVFEFFEKIDFMELLNYLIQNPENKRYSGIFKTYFAMLNAFRNFSNEEYYFEYKKQIMMNIKVLHMDEIRYHFNRLMKFCIIKRDHKSSRINFDNELFNIYDYILKKGYYRSSVADFFPVDLFRNILIQGLRLKKYKWVISFIKKYHKLLNPKIRENIYHYCLAQYYFKRKMYKDALINFHKIKMDYFMFKLDMKNLMLMAYFELRNYETALNFIDSYYHFLANDNTLSVSQKKIFKNFANVVHRLILDRTSSERTFNYKLETSDLDNIPHKDWVIEKMTEMPFKLKKIG